MTTKRILFSTLIRASKPHQHASYNTPVNPLSPLLPQSLSQPPPPPPPHQKRFQSSAPTPPSTSLPTKKYIFEDISGLLTPTPSNPSSPPRTKTHIIDVRTPSEILSTGHIPTAKTLPLTTSPDGLFLPADAFEERFGWPKPRAEDTLVFYCKAGVRSRAAAGMAREAGWVDVGEYEGSWVDWVGRGGGVEK